MAIQFQGIQLTTRFGNNIFKNIETMKVIIFSNYSKFYVDFKKSMKCQENVHGFEGNSIWISYTNFCQLWEEYMWSAIKVLNSGPKIWDSTKTHDTQLKLLDINWTLE